MSEGGLLLWRIAFGLIALGQLFKLVALIQGHLGH